MSENKTIKKWSGKHFQLTLNQVERYQELSKYLFGMKYMDYLISCKEIAPSTGHEHIHIYVHFEKSSKLANNKLCGAHVEKCKGNVSQNIAYIKKDGVILDQYGDVPKDKGGHKIKDVIAMSHEERMDLPIQYYNIVQKIECNALNDLDPKSIYKSIFVLYIHGESGIGKSHLASKILLELNQKYNNVKFQNDFWLGVGEEAEIALYDDFRDSSMKPSEFINFIDYQYHQMNIKNGSKQNKYKVILITSIQDPQEIYNGMKSEEPRKQWIRRLNILKLEQPYGENNFDNEKYLDELSVKYSNIIKSKHLLKNY